MRFFFSFFHFSSEAYLFYLIDEQRINESAGVKGVHLIDETTLWKALFFRQSCFDWFFMCSCGDNADTRRTNRGENQFWSLSQSDFFNYDVLIG